MTTDILTAIERFSALTSPESVVSTLRCALSSLDRKYFCLNLFPGQNRSFANAIIACELPQGWLDLYLQENFAAVDPAIRHCKRTVQPFPYRDAPYDPEREPRAAEVVKRARDFGVCNGDLFPIAGPNCPVGDMWIGGVDTALSKREASAIHMMGLMAFYKIQAQVQPAPAVTLTDRERQVLSWVADGKTAWEVGELLQISHRTVEWNLQQAVQKLGARNRTQAAVIAARDGLIDIG